MNKLGCLVAVLFIIFAIMTVIFACGLLFMRYIPYEFLSKLCLYSAIVVVITGILSPILYLSNGKGNSSNDK